MTALFIIGIVLCSIGVLFAIAWYIAADDDVMIVPFLPVLLALGFAITAMAIGIGQ